MRLIPSVREEHGFTMVVLMVVLLAGGMFVAGALAAAQGDLPFSGDTRDRKVAYAAAESGLNLYQSRLNADNEYWLRCDDVPNPSPGEANPINQAWTGGEDQRRWRKVPASSARYTIELLPAPQKASCVKNDSTSMIDPETATFRVRSTGQALENGRVRRSLVATFRRSSFLDFIYFTDLETRDPLAYPPGDTMTPAQAQAKCEHKRPIRDAAAPPKCSEIEFADADDIRGPFHTNDDVLTCGTPTFGRTKKDRIEMKGQGANGTGYRRVTGSACGSGSPQFLGSKIDPDDVKNLEMPASNAELVQLAKDGGYYLKGTYTLRLKGDTIDARNEKTGVTQSLAWPGNGVLYVDNDACASGIQAPIVADYKEPKTCAIVYVSGTYNQSLTIASRNDVVVDGDIIRSGDPVLGLIADNNVRVRHDVNRAISYGAYNHCAETTGLGDRRIDAAILSLKHSFTVDNYACGDRKGKLIVNGAIAQKFRGPVGTRGGPDGDTGYLKDYNYDDRLRYRSPPHFLTPVAAAWDIVKVNEQLPAH